jgi:hypothetical protein
LIQNKLVGLFYKLALSYLGLWSDELTEQLHSECSYLKLSGDRRENQVGEVLNAFQKANIPVIVLKGWALLQILYDGEYWQRPSADIDLLVNQVDIAQVDFSLNALGYRDAFVEPWPGYFRRYMNSRHYQYPQTDANFDHDFHIDIHWGIPDLPYYDQRTAVEPFFERSHPIMVSGIKTGSLGTEDYLIYACSHIMHHGQNVPLIRYYEIAAIILRAGQELKWDALFSLACRLRVVIPLQRILSTITSLWPGVISPEMMDTLIQLRPSRSERWVDWWLARVKNKEKIIGIIAWLTTPGVFKRFSYILETVVPSPNYLRTYYGPAPFGFLPLLYPWRVVEIILNRRG